MRIYKCLILPLILSLNLSGQELGFTINYRLIEAKEWNQATQVYNLSRPFLANKQPLLRHGMSLGLYYLPNTENRLAWGPSLYFSFFRSAAKNPNFDISIQSLLLDLGIKLQYQPLADNRNLNLSITPNLALTTLARKLNGELAILGKTEEDTPLRSYGLGFGLNTQITYDYAIHDNWSISPMLGASYYPYLWVNRSEVIFNESAAGSLKSATNILGLQGGVVLKRR
ncbi:MAG: hypothetical protein AAGJ93_10755 [Bacteroidota bacterium]